MIVDAVVLPRRSRADKALTVIITFIILLIGGLCGVWLALLVEGW